VRVRPRPEITIIDSAEVIGKPEEAEIRREARKLAAFFDRILAVRVTVTAPHRRLHREVITYQVRIRISVPLGELAIRRQENPEVLAAIQDAFRAARRLVQDYVGRLRETRKPRTAE
jgi:ribosome-associated translation inhibitor RaiA